MKTFTINPTSTAKTTAARNYANLNGGARMPASLSFDRVIKVVLLQIKNQERPFVVLETLDERLIHVTRWLKEIGDDALLSVQIKKCEPETQALTWNNLKFCLANLAAFLLLWITAKEPDYRNGLAAIRMERIRQKTLFLAGKIPFDCSSNTTDNRRKFRALFEEAGEVAKEIGRVEMMPTNEHAKHDLAAELVQTAAVAFAWLEAIEEKQKAES